jgi:hypothetical protein
VLAVVVVAALCAVAAVRLSSHPLPTAGGPDTELTLDECEEATGTATVPGAAADATEADEAPSCQDVLRRHIEALEPGEVLRIGPGRYDIGTVVVRDLAGTADDRIEVTALDPGRPPELVGSLHLASAEHVTVSHLDLVASERGLPALAMRCGTGWEVRDATIRGAADSGATSNMNISGSQPEGPSGRDGGETCPDEPRGFVVADNCFRDPYTDPALVDHPDIEVRRTRGFYHQLYVSFEGGEGTGGRIVGNRFQGHHNGAGVKLGNGAHHTLGAWHVQVVGNAFVDGRSAVILHDDVRDNRIEDNLVVDVSGPTNAGDDLVFYGARLREASNVISGTTAYGAAALIGLGPERSADLVDGGGNVLVDTADEVLDGELPVAADGCVAPDALPWPDRPGFGTLRRGPGPG